MTDYDVVIVGAGVAGLSLAAELTERTVLVLETEDHPATHSSGRSATVFTRTYGNSVVRSLTALSEKFLRSPPMDFSDQALTYPRPCIYVGREDQVHDLATFARVVRPACPEVIFQPDLQLNSLDVPLRRSFAAAAVIDPSAMEIDAYALLTGYRRTATATGADFAFGTRLTRARGDCCGWRLTTNSGEIRCRLLVNAAGAWADNVASAADVPLLGLRPLKRTLVCVETGMVIPAAWPFIVDFDMTLYFKPDVGRLIISPADETPSPACDAYADDWEVAVSIDRLEKATELTVKKIIAKWAGLRTFAPDEQPVVGLDPEVGGFFWFAGQGGFGLQTAPALARVAAALICGRELPRELTSYATALSPKRLR